MSKKKNNFETISTHVGFAGNNVLLTTSGIVNAIKSHVIHENVTKHNIAPIHKSPEIFYPTMCKGKII